MSKLYPCWLNHFGGPIFQNKMGVNISDKKITHRVLYLVSLNILQSWEAFPSFLCMTREFMMVSNILQLNKLRNILKSLGSAS